MKILITLTFILCIFPLMAKYDHTIKTLSLNLHGYHPMGEKERYLQDRAGNLTLTSSSIHYFKLLEIIRGNQNRLDQLSINVHELSPDIIFLQEVGAGSPNNRNKTCQDFYKKFPYDFAFENTSLRLEKKLDGLGKKYSSLLACRGNLGWFTGPLQFSEERIVTKDGNIIFDFDTNPYPHGILIEGSSIMVSHRLKVLDHQIHNDSHNYLGKRFFYQMAAISDENNNWFLAVNIHAGHKMDHFEQSILIKKNILNYLTQHHFKGTFKGVLIAGDFNARLFRPNLKEETHSDFSEVSTVLFEVKKENQFDFLLDYATENQKIQYLRQELIKLNESSYKPWASILDQKEFNRRLDDSLNEFKLLQKAYQQGAYKNYLIMQSSLETANEQGLCRPDENLAGACFFKNNIDFIMKTPLFGISNAYVAFSKNNWTSLDYISDHPGIFAELFY